MLCKVAFTGRHRQKIPALLQQNLNGCRIGIQIQVRQAFHRLQLLFTFSSSAETGMTASQMSAAARKTAVFLQFFHRILPHR